MARFSSGCMLSCLALGLVVTAITLSALITQSQLWDNRLSDDDAAFVACFSYETAQNQQLWNKGEDDRTLTNLRADFCVTAPPDCTDEEAAQVSEGIKQAEHNFVNTTARAACLDSHPRTNTEPIRAIGFVVVWLVGFIGLFLIAVLFAITRAPKRAKQRRAGDDDEEGPGDHAGEIGCWRAFSDWCVDMWEYGSLPRDQRRDGERRGLIGAAGRRVAQEDDRDHGDDTDDGGGVN